MQSIPGTSNESGNKKYLSETNSGTEVPLPVLKYLEHIHICTLITAVSLDVPIRYHVNNLLGRMVKHAYFMCSIFANVAKYFFFVGNKLYIFFLKMLHVFVKYGGSSNMVDHIINFV